MEFQHEKELTDISKEVLYTILPNKSYSNVCYVYRIGNSLAGAGYKIVLNDELPEDLKKFLFLSEIGHIYLGHYRTRQTLDYIFSAPKIKSVYNKLKPLFDDKVSDIPNMYQIFEDHIFRMIRNWECLTKFFTKEEIRYIETLYPEECCTDGKPIVHVLPSDVGFPDGLTANEYLLLILKDPEKWFENYQGAMNNLNNNQKPNQNGTNGGCNTNQNSATSNSNLDESDLNHNKDENAEKPEQKNDQQNQQGQQGQNQQNQNQQNQNQQNQNQQNQNQQGQNQNDTNTEQGMGTEQQNQEAADNVKQKDWKDAKEPSDKNGDSSSSSSDKQEENKKETSNEQSSGSSNKQEESKENKEDGDSSANSSSDQQEENKEETSNEQGGDSSDKNGEDIGEEKPQLSKEELEELIDSFCKKIVSDYQKMLETQKEDEEAKNHDESFCCGSGSGEGKVLVDNCSNWSDFDGLEKAIKDLLISRTITTTKRDLLYNYNRGKGSGNVLTPKYRTRTSYRESPMVVILDVSGSISEKNILGFVNIFKNVSSSIGEKCTIIMWDENLRAIYDSKDDNIRAISGGGTDMASAFEYVKKNIPSKDMANLFLVSDFEDELNSYNFDNLPENLYGVCWSSINSVKDWTGPMFPEFMSHWSEFLVADN